MPAPSSGSTTHQAPDPHGPRPFGTDTTTYDAYALRGRTVAARVLLPVPTAGGGVTTWEALGRARGTRVDGSVSWVELTEYPASGPLPAGFPADAEHPGGRPDARIVDVLRDSLARDGLPWCFESPGICPPADLVEALPGARPWWLPTDVSGAALLRVEAAWDDLAGLWLDIGFSGWAWRRDGACALAAPPYADSIVVSGDRALTTRVHAAGLEAHAVARDDRIRITEE